MNEQTGSDSKYDCFCGGAGPRLSQKARDFRSNATAEHFRNAGAEILKGLRSVIDVGIDYLSKEPGARGTTVNVE